MLQKKYTLFGFEGDIERNFNETADVVNVLDEGLRDAVRHLLALDRAQGEQIKRLEAIVLVLMQLIVERGVVSAEDLNAHIERALEALNPPTPAPVPKTPEGHPYRGEVPKRAAAPRFVTCVSCRESVVASDTLVTEHGALCNDCYAKGVVR